MGIFEFKKSTLAISALGLDDINGIMDIDIQDDDDNNKGDNKDDENEEDNVNDKDYKDILLFFEKYQVSYIFAITSSNRFEL